MNLENIFLFGVDVLKTVVKGTAQTILAQVGDAVQQVTEGDLAEYWQHIGFQSRPSKPVAGRQAAQALGIRRRDRDVIFATRDLRGQELAGNLSDGETCIYAPGEFGEGQARVLLKANGGINAYTRVGNVDGGAGMVIQLDAINNVARVLNGSGYGMIADADGVTITVGSASITLTAATGKIDIVGTGTVLMDGELVVLAQDTIPPVPGLNSALKGPSGVAGSPSTKVIIGA